MRQTKRCLEAFSFFNSEGICRHWEKMAAKGWLIDKMDGLGWRYRRIEPMEATFAITYCPKASEFDPEPTEEQRDFFDFCAHTGWELVLTSAQMQVFYNTRPDPIPIETEPELEYETICAAAKKSFLPSYFILLAVGLLQAFMFVGGLINAPVDKLSNASSLFTGVAWVVMLLMCVEELFCFFRWKKRARPLVEQGIYLPPPDTSRFQRICLWVVVAFGIYYVLNVLLSGDKLMITILLVMAGYMFLLIWGVNGMKDFLKRRKASRTLNRSVTIGTSFVLAFVMMGLITTGLLALNRTGIFADKDDETYERWGQTFVAPHDEIPLTMEDLLGSAERAGEIKERSGHESLLLGKYTMRQHPRFDSEAYTSMYWLEYDVVKVKVPFLYDMCRDQYLRDAEREDIAFRRYYAPIDPAPWGANEAYRLEDTAVGLRNKYLLCYDDIIVEFDPDMGLSPEQMALVGEKLGDL